jgi:general secretion pathway protein A
VFCNHFKITEQPFCERTPIERISKDERIKQSMARLQYFLSNGTIALITGQTGVGKSSLIKLFLHSLEGTNSYSPVYLHITDLRATSLLRLIVSGLGEKPKHTKGLIFSQITEISKNSQSKVLLVIDEAHLLTAEALTDLRLLVSSALDEKPLMKIVLSGQEILRQMLKRPALADLLHRISIYCNLIALTKFQTACYLDHQLNSVGASEKIFDKDVKELIHDYSGGLPRQINNIATACLINAAIQQSQRVDQKIFSQAISECLL